MTTPKLTHSPSLRLSIAIELTKALIVEPVNPGNQSTLMCIHRDIGPLDGKTHAQIYADSAFALADALIAKATT